MYRKRTPYREKAKVGPKLRVQDRTIGPFTPRRGVARGRLEHAVQQDGHRQEDRPVERDELAVRVGGLRRDGDRERERPGSESRGGRAEAAGS